MGIWTTFIGGRSFDWSKYSGDCELAIGQSEEVRADPSYSNRRTFGKVFPTKSGRDVRILGYTHSIKTGIDETMVQYLDTKDVEWILRDEIIFSSKP